MSAGSLRVAAALASGMVFGLGLSFSGMLDPVRVRAFLDVFGSWDPGLAVVLAGAVAMASLGVASARRMAQPVLDTSFHLPTATKVDRRLVAGSLIFGVGWGMGGLCPGPAITSLTLGSPAVLLFVLAMLVGMAVHDRWIAKSSQ